MNEPFIQASLSDSELRKICDAVQAAGDKDLSDYQRAAVTREFIRSKAEGSINFACSVAWSSRAHAYLNYPERLDRIIELLDELKDTIKIEWPILKQDFFDPKHPSSLQAVLCFHMFRYETLQKSGLVGMDEIASNLKSEIDAVHALKRRMESLRSLVELQRLKQRPNKTDVFGQELALQVIDAWRILTGQVPQVPLSKRSPFRVFAQTIFECALANMGKKPSRALTLNDALDKKLRKAIQGYRLTSCKH